MKYKYSLFIVFWAVFSSCKSPIKQEITPAFYVWQTEPNLTQGKKNYLDSLNCQKLYLKYLDLGLNSATQKVEPLAHLNIVSASDFAERTIVPTVFITNESFKFANNEQEIGILAQKTAQAIVQLHEQLPQNSLAEIQFDCDWTQTTREAYFLFLEKIKKYLPKETYLSATIRLHQYKFPTKTGIPPVKRGMLMFYNTGDIADIATENSIFDPKDVEKYLVGAPKKYPLPLDIALPLFSWAIVFREGVFWKIIANPILSEFEVNPALQKKSENGYEVIKSTLLDGHYLLPSDFIKIEAMTREKLLIAAEMSQKVKLSDHATLAFFQLDEQVLVDFSPDYLKKFILQGM
jgi:hypothetical protein